MKGHLDRSVKFNGCFIIKGEQEVLNWGTDKKQAN